MPHLTLSCVACGAEYTTVHRNARFCSELCRSRAKNRRNRGELEADRFTPCAVCDTSFPAMPGKLTCSEQCSQRRRLRIKAGRPIRDTEQRRRQTRARFELTCQRCGETFCAKNSRAKYCGQRCQKDWVKSPRRTLNEWLALVDRTGGGCHMWPEGAPVSSHGYPYSRCGEARSQMYVHRILYVRRHGSIPEGWEPDHTCRVKLCVREDHHELVPQGENKRRAAPFRKPQKRRIGRCPHPDTDVYWDPSGKRCCRICRNERTRMWRAEQKETA